MPTRPEKPTIELSGNQAVVPENIRETWETGWTTIGLTDPAFAANALVRAARLREEGADPGDAYLEGIAALEARHELTAVMAALERGDLQPDGLSVN